VSHFEPDQWREFLAGGHVRTVHIEDVPIWAGFLITQIADLRTQIGVLLMTQAISLHQLFQGDMTQIQAAFGQLVTANTTAKQYSQQLLTQIATLQGQLANPDGDPVTSDDLNTLNSFAAQIQQAAASTITTSTTAPPTTTTAPAAGSDTATPSDTSAPAAPVTTDTTSAPSTDTSASDSTSVAPVSDPSQPFAVDAGDAGSSQ